jgi:CheY-like chemotaxis protein
MDGIELTFRIRQREAQNPTKTFTKIIGMSANSDGSTKDQVLPSNRYTAFCFQLLKTSGFSGPVLTSSSPSHLLQALSLNFCQRLL